MPAKPHGKAELVVVEGYMDVIALHQAGFGGAVAPLGTALTEDQLPELWRLSPAPVLCFDGDAAGARAAARAAELALPLLAPDRTLKIAALPAGEDPDTLVRQQGHAGFQSILNAARPLAEALYDLLRENVGDATVEQRAALQHRLVEAASRIPDRALAREYRNALLDRFFARRRRGKPPPSRMPRTPPSAGPATIERGRILTAILLRHPSLLHDVEHAFAAVVLPPSCERLRNALRGWADHADVLDSQGLINHLTASGLEADANQVLAAVPVPLPIFASAEAMPGDAETGWWHIFGLMNRARLEEEVAAARRAFADCADEPAQRRLIALCAARDALVRTEPSEPGSSSPD